MNLIQKTTKKDEVIDLTQTTQEVVTKSNCKSGVIVLNILHTTAALSVADLDPGTDLDILDALRAMMPNLNFRHPHDPTHVPDHILSTLIGTDVTIPFEKGYLTLGKWQRLILLEFDGPKERKINTTVCKSEV